MGRRRRRVIRIVKKKLPTVFVCPKCGEEAVRVTVAKDSGRAVVMCSQCQLKDEFQAHPAAQMIDVYSYFTDRFYGVKDPRPIIPHERETHRVVPAPEEESRELTPEVASEPAVLEPQPEAQTVREVPAEEEQTPSQIVESPEHSIVSAPVESSEEKTVETPAETAAEVVVEQGEANPEEEAEPFADILQNKDKKRYSPNPLPQQSSETNQSAQ